MLMRLRTAILSIGFALSLNACGGKDTKAPDDFGPGRALNALIWSGVVAPDTVANFERQTGIKVHVSYATTNEALETRILAGHSGFDIVSPSADYFERQIKAGGYSPLDKGKLRNLKNLDPELMQKVSAEDPGNGHGVIYFWGTNGVGYNEKMVKAVAPDAPLDSWRLLFDPAVASKVAKCGIGLVDSPVDLMRAVLPYLGRDPNSQKPDDFDAAESTLAKIRPYIRDINSSDYIQSLANGDLCVALGYSGDILQARDRAREAKNGIEINYTIPKEGSIMWFNMLAIPSHAPNIDSALAFIDYMMTPKVIADVSNYTRFANANVAAQPLLLPAVGSDPAIYPPLEVRKRLTVALPDSPERLREITRMWQRFKTGG